MEIILEIIIYLLVVLGLITVCFTFFNKFTLIDNVVEKEIVNVPKEIVTYYREKTEDKKVVMNIRYKNISTEELERIKESIEVGNYNNISDIVDEINYIDSKQKNKKK